MRHTEHHLIVGSLRSSVIRVFVPISIGILLLLILGCGERAAHRGIRVVSLSPLATRALIAMGLTEHIVAADLASRLALTGNVELATLETAAAFRPTLTLVPPLTGDGEAIRSSLLAAGGRVLEVEPHDFDEAFELYTEIGDALGREAIARETSQRIGDPIARQSVRAAESTRPCLAVVVGLDPFVLAGGHSFESNMLELLGAESATHDLSEAWRVASSISELATLSPNGVLVVDEAVPVGASLEALIARVSPAFVERLPFDSEALWLGEHHRAEALLDRWAEAVARARRVERSEENCALVASSPGRSLTRSERGHSGRESER